MSMRTTLMLFCLILASCSTTQMDMGLWQSKSDPDLQSVVDRFQASEIDTVLTVMVIPDRLWSDEERADIVKNCELILADRLDSVIMVRCVSMAIPCLGASSLVEGLLLSPPWSPDL